MVERKKNCISLRTSVEDISERLTGKRVLVRVDFNVPIENGKIMDCTRIKSTIPTIKYILEKNPKSIILMSHCGRPDGLVKKEFSLAPCAKLLEELLGQHVIFLNDCVGDKIVEECNKAEKGSVILLENLRFHLEEEGKGVSADGKSVTANENAIKEFREALTQLGDIYINDAFGTAHRAHSSVVGIYLPIRAAGLLMKKELNFFAVALEAPKRPFLAILGGAKVSDKIQLIKNLLDKVDKMYIGGGMAYTFLKVLHNMNIGNSLFDEPGSHLVKEIMKQSEEKKVEICFPEDFIAADSFSENAKTEEVTIKTGIKPSWMGLDCGPLSCQKARDMIMSSKMILWNGPQGRFEWPKFAKGSLCMLDAVIEATQKNETISIVGGGDTASLVENAGKSHLISHVSTGGGASLELLEGKTLPGVENLSFNTDLLKAKRTYTELFKKLSTTEFCSK